MVIGEDASDAHCHDVHLPRRDGRTPHRLAVCHSLDVEKKPNRRMLRMKNAPTLVATRQEPIRLRQCDDTIQWQTHNIAR